MTTSPFRWRLPNRKSSTPFFPGAWPNGPVQGQELTGNNTADLVERNPEDTGLQVSLGAQATSSKSEWHADADESFKHIDRVTDFHRKLSLSLDLSHPGPSHSSDSESPGLTDPPQLLSYTVCTKVFRTLQLLSLIPEFPGFLPEPFKFYHSHT